MSDIPDSIRARARDNDESFLDLWLTISAEVRDALYERALREEAGGVCLEWAIEEVANRFPWIPEGDERNATAFSGLTYGCGRKLWGFEVVDEDGNKLDPKRAREIMATDGHPDRKTTFIQWPLLSQEK